ncbi:MAG: HAD-IA family hydrolase [Gemmatimonadetes bacterium]|nr:HAD-IA family hydrolase [Gemmatimonadota bacterium]
MTPPPATLLFDLDGTLVDTIGLILGSMHHAFAGRDRVPTDADWLAQLGRPLPVMMAPYADGDADVAHLIDRYREHQLTEHDVLIRPYPHATDVVRELHARGHRLGVVTSKAERTARRALDWAGMTPHFDVLVGLESTREHKPDPAPVRYALAQLGGTPERAWMIGDSPFDLQSGRGAGTRTCAALWGPFDRATLEAERPDALATGMRDLLSILAS